MNSVSIPASLRTGDQIRIVSPSGVIQPDYVRAARKILENKGFVVTVGVNALNEYGRFAGTEQERTTDMQIALDDPSVKAIVCSRGGYGLSQIIDKLNFAKFIQQPKWIVGFSDITVLHTTVNRLGVASLHSIMAKHLVELPLGSEQIERFFDTLTGHFKQYEIHNDIFCRQGETEGVLVGGNLSVLFGLRGTPYEPDYRGKILFIEDIAEKPYHIDRMIQNLRLGGVFEQISGLVVGQFSDCDEDPSMHKTIKEIIFSAVSSCQYPVCFNFPAGHVDYNLPLVMGASVRLEVGDQLTTLSWI